MDGLKRESNFTCMFPKALNNSIPRSAEECGVALDVQMRTLYAQKQAATHFWKETNWHSSR